MEPESSVGVWNRSLGDTFHHLGIVWKIAIGCCDRNANITPTATASKHRMFHKHMSRVQSQLHWSHYIDDIVVVDAYCLGPEGFAFRLCYQRPPIIMFVTSTLSPFLCLSDRWLVACKLDKRAHLSGFSFPVQPAIYIDWVEKLVNKNTGKSINHCLEVFFYCNGKERTHINVRYW